MSATYPAQPPSTIPPQLISLKQAKRSFTLHNARSTAVSPMFIGNILTVPPVHEVGPYADTDADGDPIPGTRVIEDTYVFDPILNDDLQILDAQRCVIHILGLQKGGDGNITVAASPYAISGLSLLPLHSPKSMWKMVAADGEKRAFQASVERARAHIRQVEEANAKRKAAGTEPLSSDYEYERAVFLVNQSNELMKKQVSEQIAPHQADAMSEELEMEVAVKAIALEMATRAAEGRQLDKLQLAKELLNDPGIRMKLQKEYKIRKRGNLPVSAEELKAAEAEGQMVEDLEP